MPKSERSVRFGENLDLRSKAEPVRILLSVFKPGVSRRHGAPRKDEPVLLGGSIDGLRGKIDPLPRAGIVDQDGEPDTVSRPLIDHDAAKISQRLAAIVDIVDEEVAFTAVRTACYVNQQRFCELMHL